MTPPYKASNDLVKRAKTSRASGSWSALVGAPFFVDGPIHGVLYEMDAEGSIDFSEYSRRYQNAIQKASELGLCELVPHWEAVAGLVTPTSYRLTPDGRAVLDESEHELRVMLRTRGSR